MIKDSELKLIKQLEKEIRVELKELSHYKIGIILLSSTSYKWYGPGFSVDKEGDVIGLNLPEMKLGALPVTLLKFNHLEKLSFYGTKIHDFSMLEKLTNLVSLSIAFNPINDTSFLNGLRNLKSIDSGRKRCNLFRYEGRWRIRYHPQYH